MKFRILALLLIFAVSCTAPPVKEEITKAPGIQIFQVSKNSSNAPKGILSAQGR